MRDQPVRFGVIGLDHPHVIGMTRSLVDAGAELACILPQEGPLAKGDLELHAGVARARYGGILTDRASHQAEQFLHFTGATENGRDRALALRGAGCCRPRSARRDPQRPIRGALVVIRSARSAERSS